MNSKPIKGTTFWNDLNAEIGKGGGVGHFNDGDLQYAAMNANVQMLPIVRTAEELFEDTVNRMNTANNFKAVINGNVWDLTNYGYTDVVIGHDPVAATETIPIGLIISSGRIVTGQNAPERFYISFTPPTNYCPSNYSDAYEFGFGDPPFSSTYAMGGLGPIILKKLKYGTRNIYKSGCPSGAPTNGAPGSTYAPYIIQRSNLTYTRMLSLGPSKGKVAIALCRSAQKFLLLVQPDGASTGITLDALRDKLAMVGVDDAVFLDGSDSAMLVTNGTWHIRQGDNKNEATTTGLGFK